MIEKKSAFRKRISAFEFKNISYKDLSPFFEAVLESFIRKTCEVLSKMSNVKSYAVLEAIFIKPNNSDTEVDNLIPADDNSNISSVSRDQEEQTDEVNVIGKSETTQTFYLQSGTNLITPTTRLNVWFEQNVVSPIVAAIDRLQENGSGWALHEIRQIDVTYNKSSSFNASSYIPLPEKIKKKHSIVNVKNYDNKCFLWVILSALHPADQHSDRLSNYLLYEDELNIENISFPVALSEIDTFENNNPTISVNVYSLHPR